MNNGKVFLSYSWAHTLQPAHTSASGGHLSNAPKNFSQRLAKPNNSRERKKKIRAWLKNSLASLAQMIFRFAKCNAKCVPLHLTWNYCVHSCHVFRALAFCSACIGASCAKNLTKTKCEIWDAVINEQENLNPHCLRYRNYMRLTDLRVVCGKRMSFVYFSIRLKEKINADVNQRQCEMCFEFCVHDLVDYPIFIRTESTKATANPLIKNV